MINDLFKIDSLNIENNVDILFNYFREKGFPNYQKENYDAKKQLLLLEKFDETKLLNGNTINQSMHGCGFLWTYFEHWVNVKCGDEKKSLIENWMDDEKLKSLIRKTYLWQIKHGNGKFTINRLRQNSKIYLNKQSVSNFRPSVAKYIYNTYSNNGVVWDMSSGFGGRLFGFYASNAEKYIGTDPSVKTHNGLIELKKDFDYKNKTVELNMIGSEHYIPKSNSIDLCFTSPPYYDTEKYSTEQTQSFLSYRTKQDWLNDFIGKTLSNCKVGLKKDGYLIINISNVKSYKDLESDFLKTALYYDFELIKEYKMILSSVAGKGVKTEPIFVFKNK